MSVSSSKRSVRRIRIDEETAKIDRDVFDVLRLIKGLTAGEVAERSGVSPTTIAKWRYRLQDGGTRWPRHDTMSKVVQSMGYKYGLEPLTDDVPEFEDHPGAGLRVTSLEVENRPRKKRKN